MSILATRYAESLLSLAIDKNKVSEYKDEIKLIKKAFDDAEVIKFFESSKVSKEEKKNLCKTIFDGKIDKYVLNFLYVLVDRGRIVKYKEIFEEFNSMCLNELNIEEGIIESPRPIEQSLIEELEKMLAKDGKKVELSQKINKSLISGFKITLPSKIIDNSMKEKISKMQEALKRKDGNLWS